MNIHWLKITESTNKDAWAGRDSAQDGTVWCAEYQSAGRGQRGNRWESAAGENLMFSILFKPRRMRAADQFVLSQVCAVGVARYLKEKGIAPVYVKWPNDVYVASRKVCGMLLENAVSGDTLSVCVAGIGINVNQASFPPELPNPTSVLLSLGGGGAVPARMDLREELGKVLEHILGLYGRIGEDGRVPGLDQEYGAMLFRLGEEAWYEETEYFTGGQVHRFRGCIVGVEKETARLVVRHGDGRPVKYYFKEIKYIL